MRLSLTVHAPFRNAPYELTRILLAPLLLAIAFSAFAVEIEDIAQSPDWLRLFLGLFGGLALFLGGLQMLSEGMTKAAGGKPLSDLVRASIKVRLS